MLPQFMGTLVHNAWGTYFQLPAQHALCGAHLLCELRGLAEHHDQVWAGALRNALRTVHHQQNEDRLTPEIALAFEHQFDILLDAGLKANPSAAPVAGRRGQTKQSPGRNLALRCKQHRFTVLLFLHDEGVTFDNNQAEQDIRPWCVRRKVSEASDLKKAARTSPASEVTSQHSGNKG